VRDISELYCPAHNLTSTGNYSKAYVQSPAPAVQLEQLVRRDSRDRNHYDGRVRASNYSFQICRSPKNRQTADSEALLVGIIVKKAHRYESMIVGAQHLLDDLLTGVPSTVDYGGRTVASNRLIAS